MFQQTDRSRLGNMHPPNFLFMDYQKNKNINLIVIYIFCKNMCRCVCVVQINNKMPKLSWLWYTVSLYLNCRRIHRQSWIRNNSTKMGGQSNRELRKPAESNRSSWFGSVFLIYICLFNSKLNQLIWSRLWFDVLRLTCLPELNQAVNSG